MKKKILKFFKKQFPLFYIFFAICLASFVAECIFVYGPEGSAASILAEQEDAFDKYWEEEGAAKFQAVGLQPTEKLYNEELARHMEKVKRNLPETNPEERLKELKKDFQTWWDAEGKDAYIAKGIYPDESTYRREESKYLRDYKNGKLIYSIRLEANDPQLSQLFLSWILFPSFLLLFANACALLFAARRLTRRYGTAVSIGFFAAATILGNAFICLFGQTSFFARAEAPYTSMLIATAFLLGSITIGKNKDDYDKIEIAIPAAIFVLNIIIAWFVGPQIFVAGILVSAMFFGAGIAVGKFFPARKKSKKELALEKAAMEAAKPKVDPIVAKKKKTRDLLMEGFESAMKGDFVSAKDKLGQGMHEVLLETPIDQELLLDMAKKLTNPTLYIDVSSTEWMEWGMASFQKNAGEAALLFLEKALAFEKDQQNARKILLYVGGIRLRKNLNPEEGILRLKKVVELKDDDLFAEQAKKLLAKFAPKFEVEAKAKKEAEAAKLAAKQAQEEAENPGIIRPKKLSDYKEEDDPKPAPPKQAEPNPESAPVQPKAQSPFNKNPFASSPFRKS